MHSAIGMSWVILEEQWIARANAQAGRPSYPDHRPIRRRTRHHSLRRAIAAIIASINRHPSAPAAQAPAVRRPVGCAA